MQFVFLSKGANNGRIGGTRNVDPPHFGPGWPMVVQEILDVVHFENVALFAAVVDADDPWRDVPPRTLWLVGGGNGLACPPAVATGVATGTSNRLKSNTRPQWLFVRSSAGAGSFFSSLTSLPRSLGPNETSWPHILAHPGPGEVSRTAVPGTSAYGS